MSLDDMRKQTYATAKAMRAYVLMRDAEGHAAREIAFENFKRESLFPQAVIRWIREIGERVR
jgi:hypothetical protein